jgi:hypothetical protein
MPLSVWTRFGFSFKFDRPLAKLLPHFIKHGAPVQLAASLGQSSEISRIQNCTPLSAETPGGSHSMAAPPGKAHGEGTRRKPRFLTNINSVRSELASQEKLDPFFAGFGLCAEHRINFGWP